MTPCVYIMASRPRGTLYIGVTSDIAGRHDDHYNRHHPDSFTARHNVRRLVWMEHHDTMADAIQRERNLKHWLRAWKLDLVEADNPHWHPLDPLTGEPVPEEEWSGPYASFAVDTQAGPEAEKVDPRVKPEDDGV